jgi:phosphatidylethanolamine/phosphatidyl-N-methylethanolamine N-methyltransferase
MTTHSNHSDFVRFFRSLLANPRRISAIAPSSESLARLITKEINPEQGPVLELGSGTGVFTKSLVNRGIKEEDLTLVEFDQNFAHILKHRYPKARVVQMDASHIAQHQLYTPNELTAVISGLPLLSMSPQVVSAILAGSFDYLKADGCFYQFTYFPRCPVARPILEKLGLEADCIGRTVRNLPPACVYRISRQPVYLSPATGLGHRTNQAKKSHKHKEECL